MLKAYVGSHDEEADRASSIAQVRDNIKHIIGNDQSLARIPHNYSSIDLVAFFFLNYGFEVYDELFDESNPPQFMTEHLLNEFIKRQPFMKALRDGIQSPLHLCVKWCEEQLRLNHPMALQDAPVEPSPDMRCWWHNIRVFCTLWGVMVHLVRAKSAPGWYTQCESAFGIPPSELLVTLSWMICAETTSSDSLVSDVQLLEHAADGAKNLLQLDESQLWIDFLNKFEWMNELVNPGDDEKSFESCVQQQLRRYVSEMLRIKLPHPAESQPGSVVDMSFCGYSFDDIDMNAQMSFN
ncbi:hypothetical protein F66182_11177 [Fusarium sp. NRRL 66182]|nr:hypothetical protein F66182_11177 [Fusarium sp. NRRL 66182]